MTGLRSQRSIDPWYLALCGIVLVLMVTRTLNGIWGGDFWEHAAVVRELATHPFHPRHPLFASDAPNAFFSPYSLVIAMVGRVLHLGSITVLAAAGIVNLLVLFVGVYRFATDLDGDRKAPFFALLFILFLWGIDPWLYSGFLHFAALGYVLPYPSTFAAGLVLLSLSSTIRYLRERDRGCLFAVLVMTWLILLTHPLSAILLAVGIVSLVLGEPVEANRNRRRTTRDLGTLGGVGVIAGALAALWPYYPLIALLTREGAAFHESNQPMYEGLFVKTFPALFGLVPLFARLRYNRLDPLVLMFLGLASIYAYGWLTDQWSYGRVASFMVIVPQLALAHWCAKAVQGPSRRLNVAVSMGLTIFLIMVVKSFREAFLHSLPGQQSNYAQYRFLADYTGQYDVVLADAETSWFVPPFGGKVVANRSMAFIEDRTQRLADVGHFFDPATPAAERLDILDKYRVDYLLLDRANPAVSDPVLESLGRWGTPVYQDAKFVLIKRARERV